MDKKDVYNYMLNKYKKDQLQEINIFGIRYNNKNDLFDDTIGYFDLNGNIFVYKGTTEPSQYWTLKPMRKKGAARLIIGFHEGIWERGKHRGKYDALVQRNKCKIIRDSNKNQKSDEKIIKEGLFGINLHRASKYKILNKIGKYSAGCQVIQNPSEFNKIMDIVYFKTDQPRFNYNLFNGDNL
jgi:hypothetical protein